MLMLLSKMIHLNVKIRSKIQETFAKMIKEIAWNFCSRYFKFAALVLSLNCNDRSVLYWLQRIRAYGSTFPPIW